MKDYKELTTKIIKLLQNDPGQPVKDSAKKPRVERTFLAGYLKALENQSYVGHYDSFILLDSCNPPVTSRSVSSMPHTSRYKERLYSKKSSFKGVGLRPAVSARQRCNIAVLLTIIILGAVLLRVNNSLPLFNLVISSVSDQIGDVDSSYGYVDVVHAEVLQTSLTTLQFKMTVRSAVPLDPGQNTVVYLWMIDTDLNPGTGQRHFFVGSEYNVRVAFYESHWQGWVDPIDQPSGGGQCPVLIDNNTISIIVGLSQIGGATHFNWEISASDDHANDGADSFAFCQILSWLPNSSMISEVSVKPPLTLVPFTLTKTVARTTTHTVTTMLPPKTFTQTITQEVILTFVALILAVGFAIGIIVKWIRS